MTEFLVSVVGVCLHLHRASREENVCRGREITEELLRKCSEHNECEIFSLEELSLHQRNLVKIEHLDKWCRDLKILYLHNNLISKIENLNRLKKLEYINFTLNNITKIENLEGCESLKKLDFTVNFIGELTSVGSLKENYNLEELYLTGNPCVDYEGYREYVVATLSQLKILDGVKIKASERIIAMQKYHIIRGYILNQQKQYMKKIGKTDDEIDKSIEEHWSDTDEIVTAESNESFWKQPTSHTPQSRIDIFKHMEKTRYKGNKEKKTPKRPKRLFTDDGRPLNINEPKLDFEFLEDEEANCYKLDLAVYKYMSTSLLEADVQPNYVRVKVKGKIFQLHLPKEVSSDSSTSLRSQTTGHLLITMPKVEDVLKPNISYKKGRENFQNNNKDEVKEKKCTTLEVTSSIVDSLSQIVREADQPNAFRKNGASTPTTLKENLEFIDNPEVPPLI